MFVYVLEYLLTLVSLDKLQNVGTLMHKCLKSQGMAF